MNPNFEYISHSTTQFLELLDEYDVKITFFITGDYYQHFPDLVAEIDKQGHEIGYHRHTHCRLVDPDTLCRELEMSTDFLTRYSPKGFRAPWVFLPEPLLSVLADAGFEYDSSTVAAAGQYANIHNIHSLPVTSIPLRSQKLAYGKSVNTKMLTKEIPIGSGIMVSYLRKWYSNILSRHTNKNLSCIFYLHLWQLYTPPDTVYKGLRRIHAYPLEQQVRNWLQTHRFGKMSSLMTDTASGKHFLTIDLEI